MTLQDAAWQHRTDLEAVDWKIICDKHDPLPEPKQPITCLDVALWLAVWACVVYVVASFVLGFGVLS